MKLLIAEDQLKTGQYLALSGDYDLLILDVMLPGRDGWQLLQAVRSACKPGSHTLTCEYIQRWELACLR